MLVRRFVTLVSFVILGGCTLPTAFRGGPVVPTQKSPAEAPGYCQQICRDWGMELSGMVSMGEHYSDGCICSLPGKQVSPAAAATSAQIAAAGVMIEEQERERAARRHQTQNQDSNRR